MKPNPRQQLWYKIAWITGCAGGKKLEWIHFWRWEHRTPYQRVDTHRYVETPQLNPWFSFCWYLFWLKDFVDLGNEKKGKVLTLSRPSSDTINAPSKIVDLLNSLIVSPLKWLSLNNTELLRSERTMTDRNRSHHHVKRYTVIIIKQKKKMKFSFLNSPVWGPGPASLVLMILTVRQGASLEGDFAQAALGHEEEDCHSLVAKLFCLLFGVH